MDARARARAKHLWRVSDRGSDRCDGVKQSSCVRLIKSGSSNPWRIDALRTTVCLARDGESSINRTSPIAAFLLPSWAMIIGGRTFCSTATISSRGGQNRGSRTIRRQSCSRCWSRTFRIQSAFGSSKRFSNAAAGATSPSMQWDSHCMNGVVRAIPPGVLVWSSEPRKRIVVSAGRIHSRQRAALVGVVRSEEAKKGSPNKALQQNRDDVLRS
jgi:hypothetical protein